jgi:hypothetical protein
LLRRRTRFALVSSERPIEYRSSIPSRAGESAAVETRSDDLCLI